MNQLRSLALLCALLLLPPLAADAQAETPPTNPYGIVEGFWFPDVTCHLNPGWERIIFDWAQHQPDGPTDWHTLNVDDRWLKAANQCNREVVAVVKNTPAWATAGMPGPGVPSGLYLPVDDPDNHWANFIRQSAAYYAPRGVHRFIIWNEPDIQPGTYGFEFSGSLEDYAQMVRVASIAAKQGNPAARVHLAGMTYWHNVNQGERLYLDRLLEHLTTLPDAAEHDSYFDAISLHIYFRTDTVYEIITEARTLLANYGLAHKAIWVNETNAPPTQDPDWPVDRPVFQYTLAQQAAFLLQAAALAPAAGAERIAAYKLYDQELPPGGETFGLLVPDTQATRPAFDAWRTATTRYTQVSTADLIRSGTVSLVHMSHTDETQTITAWSRTDDDARLVVAGGSGEVYSYLVGDAPVEAFTGETVFTLPAAVCNGDDPAVPCPVGGEPVIITTEDDISIHEIQSDGTIVQLFGP